MFGIHAGYGNKQKSIRCLRKSEFTASCLCGIKPYERGTRNGDGPSIMYHAPSPDLTAIHGARMPKSSEKQWYFTRRYNYWNVYDLIDILPRLKPWAFSLLKNFCKTIFLKSRSNDRLFLSFYLFSISK